MIFIMYKSKTEFPTALEFKLDFFLLMFLMRTDNFKNSHG